MTYCRYIGRALASVSVLAACVVTVSCRTPFRTAALPYPHKATFGSGPKLPIDGTWLSRNKLRFRIANGIMYVDDPGVNLPLRDGCVIGTNIVRASDLKYTLAASCQNIGLWRVGFGRGEIEVLSRTSLVVRTFPNEEMRLWETAEDIYTVGQVDAPDVFLAAFDGQSSQSSAKKVSDGTTVSPEGKGSRWAVIVGVSSYKDTRVPSLRYAEADADAFHKWATSPTGGGFAPANVKVLLGKEATGERVKDALFNWLKQALAEDVVTIYFACHGSPESPDSSENQFLLPYDADYEKIATTGFPMWDIETALKRFIKARKVVVIADACHSGGVGQSFDIARRDNRGIKVNSISSGIQNLSKVSDGVCVMSASDTSQMSQESEEWGGGHGVFTHFLLKGLKGEADYNKDGQVTLGEIIPYTSEQVRRATKSAQSPTVAGKFDPALTIGK